MKLEDSWQPSQPGNIREIINHALTENRVQWQEPALGYPGTSTDPFVQSMAVLFGTINPNNIGLHWHPDRSHTEPTEHGFSGGQELERKAIKRLIRIAGGQVQSISGYLTSCGTEANLQGLRAGRNYLAAQLFHPEEWPMKTAILMTPLAHYSGYKVAEILGFPDSSRPERQDRPYGISQVGCQPDGSMDINLLNQRVKALADDGTKHILIFATAGTTLIGSVDDIGLIHQARLNWLADWGAKSFLHVDAAFGGFVLPFLSPPIDFGFDVGADAVVIDPHKMGGVGFGCGSFLCHSRYIEYVASSAPYINSEIDETISGSRSGSVAAACYAALESNGFSGYQTTVHHCLGLTDYLGSAMQELILDHRLSGWKVIRGKTNQFCLTMTEAPQLSMREVLMKYYLHAAQIPSDLRDPFSTKAWGIKFICMPHLTPAMIDQFIADLRRTL